MAEKVNVFRAFEALEGGVVASSCLNSKYYFGDGMLRYIDTGNVASLGSFEVGGEWEILQKYETPTLRAIRVLKERLQDNSYEAFEIIDAAIELIKVLEENEDLEDE